MKLPPENPKLKGIHRSDIIDWVVADILVTTDGPEFIDGNVDHDMEALADDVRERIAQLNARYCPTSLLLN